jgi:heat shock transcription factor 2
MSTVKYPVPKAALMPTKPVVKVAPVKKAEEAPIFLQKTYHMIDTCDPTVCCWSEDGKTFIVKNTTAFEKEVIPQFFKHNKFASFVRQLNFYGFRKIKYSDSLRIDPKLEAKTAHYWRFKHDKFMKGRKDLLVEIKRCVGGVSGSNGGGVAVASQQKIIPVAIPSSAVVQASKPEEVTRLNSEVQELKQRIASMTKNIDDLTSMVKNISVKDEEAPVEQAAPGQKRKKIKAESEDSAMLDWSTPVADPFPALLSEVPLPDAAPSSEAMSIPASSVSDDAFVDELFDVFANEEGELLSMSSLEDVSSSNVSSNPNKPDPQLMKRIEESLSTLPKDMHEMVADRLIDAIANTQPIAESAGGLFSDNGSNRVDDSREEETNENVVSLPVAVATLRTILAGYGVSVECHRECKDQEGRLAKSLPVVPMHA